MLAARRVLLVVLMAIIATSYDINDPQEDHSTHAMELDEEGDIKGAIASFKAASRFQPSQSYTWNNLGTALADEGNPSRNEDLKQARRSFRKAVEADPDNEEKKEKGAGGATTPRHVTAVFLGLLESQSD